jgi:Uma2 family endonuclease
MAGHEPTRDRRTLLSVSWDEYSRRLEQKGELHRPRLAYLDGTLEIMSPSVDHEWIGQITGRLLEVYCLENGIDFSGLGQWTLRSKLKDVGLEPDNCYVFGPWRGRRRPDLAIEVVWTRGGLAKLEIYRRLHVPEVWFWKKGAIEMYGLRRDGYRRLERSKFVPNIDLVHLCSFLDRRVSSRAMQEYRERLRRAF